MTYLWTQVKKWTLFFLLWYDIMSRNYVIERNGTYWQSPGVWVNDVRSATRMTEREADYAESEFNVIPLNNPNRGAKAVKLFDIPNVRSD